MKKNQIIILAVVIVLIIAGIIGWVLVQKSKIYPKEEKIEEVFSLQAIVSSVDAENNFLMVKPLNQETELKVIISETTKIFKIEFPFDLENPPKGTQLTPIQTEVEFSDFKSGDDVFIKTTENIAGKTEFDNVDFIHILP
jgi:hypothetical protein